jgi:hypothetical protein
MSDSIFDNMKEWKNAAIDYTDAQIRFFKLQMVEGLSHLFSDIINSLIILFLALFALLFICLALSFYFGDLLGSRSLGFLAGAAIFIMLIILFILLKKPLVEKPIIKSLVKVFFPEK